MIEFKVQIPDRDGLKDKEVTFEELVDAYNQEGGWDKFIDVAEKLVHSVKEKISL